jgi:hypothetical protein
LTFLILYCISGQKNHKVNVPADSSFETTHFEVNREAGRAELVAKTVSETQRDAVGKGSLNRSPHGLKRGLVLAVPECPECGGKNLTEIDGVFHCEDCGIRMYPAVPVMKADANYCEKQVED